MTSHVCAAIKTNAVAIMTQVKSSEGCAALIVLRPRYDYDRHHQNERNEWIVTLQMLTAVPTKS
jgi:hypothetical protein